VLLRSALAQSRRLLCSKGGRPVVLSSYWVAPLLAIITIHWLQRRGKYPLWLVTEWRALATDWRPLAALVIAFALQVPFMNVSALWVGPIPTARASVDLTYLVGAVAGAVIYVVLERVGAPPERIFAEGTWRSRCPRPVRSAAADPDNAWFASRTSAVDRLGGAGDSRILGMRKYARLVRSALSRTEFHGGWPVGPVNTACRTTAQ
jgi:hypothetical protein